MQGAEWTWNNADDELERCSCLLTGIAVLTTKGTTDPLRKADAFNGCVMLPFLETAMPTKERALCLALVPHLRRWVLFTIRHGRPQVVSSRRGFEGLADAVIRIAEEMT